MGEEVLSQLFAKPKAMIIASLFLGLMMFSGLPKVPLLLLGSCCGGLAYTMGKTQKRATLVAAARHALPADTGA